MENTNLNHIEESKNQQIQYKKSHISGTLVTLNVADS